MVKAYYPTTLEEALSCLREDSKSVIYAGGTDIMVVNRPMKSILFLSQVKELFEIEEDEEYLSIGAAVTFTDLLYDPRIPEIFTYAIEHVAAPAIRNVATIGGNVCNASPAGDTLPVLYILDACVELVSLQQEEKIVRQLAIEDFITGVKKTRLEEGEILTRILLPKKSLYQRGFYHYEKVGARKAQAISKVSFCACLLTKEDCVIDLRIAFGAVGPTVVRSKELEKFYIGRSKEALLADKEKIIMSYASCLKPIDDQRSSARYRKQVCLNLLDDFLEMRLHR